MMKNWEVAPTHPAAQGTASFSFYIWIVMRKGPKENKQKEAGIGPIKNCVEIAKVENKVSQ